MKQDNDTPSFSLDIEPEADSDHEAIRLVVVRAFHDNDDVADLIKRIRASPNYLPGLSLVAREGTAVVGHIMLSHVVLVDDAGLRHQVVTLSPVSVDPEHQGQGIGGALVEAALARADESGEPLVVLEGHPGYYPRFGFEPAGDYGVTIDLPDWAPLEAAMVHPLSDYEQATRGKLEYSPAFSHE